MSNELTHANFQDELKKGVLIDYKGVFVQCDLKEAQPIESYTVGDHVLFLVDDRWYEKDPHNWKQYAGIIVRCNPYADLPSLEVLYVSNKYGGYEVKIQIFNKDTQGFKIMPFISGTVARINAQHIENYFQIKQREIEGRIQELNLERKLFRSYFLGKKDLVDITDDENI